MIVGFSLFTIISMTIGILIVCFTSPKSSMFFSSSFTKLENSNKYLIEIKNF